ncbi:FAD-binding oxidoreductase [Mumia sp. DW29H23]|uniref:FAD-binding oxidoreductase n=1 Tax=Mumia sp. DW29H23 TaxID=3421241 RepID=UPI003D68C2E5
MTTTTETQQNARIDVPGFRGELIEPGDAAYDDARAVYNGSIDRHPRLIARAVDTADVVAAVRAAREHGLPVAVRGGAHNAGGLAVGDDALVVDLSRMRSVHVDPAERVVRVEGGATWGDVDHATHAFGLAVPSGIISTTGVGGLTLGGGLGYLARQFGLTIDSLLSADVVLADGSVVTADAERHPDLFWALRGGGGNFGAVTSFTFRAHPVADVVGGPMFFDVDRATEVMQAWDAMIGEAPDEVSCWFGFVTVPPVDPFPAELQGHVVAALVWCINAPEERAAEALAPFRDMGPLMDGVGTMPFPALQSAFDALYPPGHQWYWRADFVDALGDDALAVHQRYGPTLPTPQSTMHLYPINGAAGRVGRNDTAFSHRQARYAQVIVGVDPEAEGFEKVRGWTREYHDALHPYSAGGAYVNMLQDDEGLDRVMASYRDNFDRLTAVKDRYDPDNVFCLNKNVPPRTSQEA